MRELTEWPTEIANFPTLKYYGREPLTCFLMCTAFVIWLIDYNRYQGLIQMQEGLDFAETHSETGRNLFPPFYKPVWYPYPRFPKSNSAIHLVGEYTIMKLSCVKVPKQTLYIYFNLGSALTAGAELNRPVVDLPILKKTNRK